MSIHSNLYVHPMDQSALKTLKAIPGFTPLLKAYMKALSEQQFRIENMATNLRVSEKQLPEYYRMLPPICERLGIEVPELYLKLDGDPNAYTSGDTKPFIVLTTGLVEKFPMELIPAVIAHECGHIACHHVLYHNMGNILLSAAASALGLGDLFTLPIQSAFAHWLRCSELSADRAASIAVGCDGVVDYCMRFAGYPSGMGSEPNREAFMEQAHEYRDMMHDSTWNKVLELLMYGQADHPINAVRALECVEWCQSEQYHFIMNYRQGQENQALVQGDVYCPLPEAASFYVHQNAFELKAELEKSGFSNVEMVRSTALDSRFQIGQTVSLSINGDTAVPAASWHKSDAAVQIHYYEPLSEEEIIAAHPGEIRVPDSSRHFVGSHYQQVIFALKDAGFTAFIVQEQRDAVKSWFTKDKEVIRITIAGQDTFEKGTWFKPDATVRILYRVHPGS